MKTKPNNGVKDTTVTRYTATRKWIIANKWRILMTTYRVIVKWDTYSDNVTWAWSAIKHLF